MESMASVMDKMKMYLISLDYPNMNIFTEDDIVQIFAPRNRIKLLMWALNQLSDTIAVPLDEEAQILYMSDIIYEWGFCKSSDKVALVKCELDVREQFIIFSRLFWFLLNKEPRCSALKEVDFEHITNMASQSSLLKKKVQKSISLKSYDDHRKEIADNLIRLQNEIDGLETVEEFDLPQLKHLNIDGLEDDLASFSNNLGIILGSKSINPANSGNTLELCRIELLDKTVSTLQDAMEHLTNTRVVSDHKEMPPLIESGNGDDWFDKNYETLQRMLHKCEIGKGLLKN